MKKIVITAFCSIFIVALAVAQNTGNDSATNGDAAQQVKQLEQQIRAQVVKGDTTGLERYESDDFVLIDGAGMMMDKNQSVQGIKDGSVKYRSIQVKDEKIRTYGDTVIYNGVGTVGLTVHGQDRSGDNAVTIVWAKQNGQWKRVSFQATPVMSQMAK